MNGWRRAAWRAAVACCLALPLLCYPALASQDEGVDLPARWQVQADGWTGTLTLNVDASGRVSGTLGDRPVTGFLSGRHLLFHRTGGGHEEVWQGWLPEGSAPPALFVAGSVTVGGSEGERVHPWYAVPEHPAAAGDPTVLTQEEGADPEPPGGAESSPPEPSLADPVVISPSAAPWDGPDISGAWLSPDGPVEILQQGRSLTVVLPGGTRHGGRFTATDTLVAGLAKGCCKGKLQRPDLIAWSDGSVWRRSQ
jgi:hypothetical protein